MKILTTLAATLALGVSIAGSGVKAALTPAEVQVQTSGQDPCECSRAVLHWNSNDDRFYVDLQVRKIPDYNRYQLLLGNKELNDKDRAPNLSGLRNGGASWLVVVDTSDEGGRQETIDREKRILARLHSLMDAHSRVGVYSLSRELRELPPLLGGQGKGFGYQVEFVDSKGLGVWNPAVRAEVGQMFEYVPAAANANTYLWVGLMKALKEELPKLAKDSYAYMPKGIILLSDGVDESSSSADDLNRLVEEAKKQGVAIHTIGFPNKDSRSNKGNATSLHRGFNFLQRLAVETGGMFLSYEEVSTMEAGAESLIRMVRATETNLLTLDFPISAVKAGDDIALCLWEGSNTLLANMTINQYEVAKVVGDYYLWCVCQLVQAARKAESAEDQNKLLLQAGLVLVRNIQPLPVREDLFKYTDADEPIVNRARQVLAALDMYPALLKGEVKRAESEGGNYVSDLIRQCGICLLNFSAPLPEPENQVQDSRPIINVSAPNSTSVASASGGSFNEEDSLQDWVWWSLSIGGTALSILFFWVLVKVMAHRGYADDADGSRGGGQAHTGSTCPVLATLVNVANPAQEWVVCSESCSVGRKASNDVVLPFAYVSNTQFLLVRSHTDGWTLKDAHSTNGTVVNGKKVSSGHLNSGDIIRIADLELEFKTR